MLLQTISVLSVTVVLFGSLEGVSNLIHKEPVWLQDFILNNHQLTLLHLFNLWVSLQTTDDMSFCLTGIYGKAVQMQRAVQCCMRYSQGKVRTKDVLKFEVQTEGPDCSIRAIILYTKKAVKCADPRDRKVKRLLRKLNQRQRAKVHRTMWLHPRGNLPVMSEIQ